jgi:hypothetical protein
LPSAVAPGPFDSTACPFPEPAERISEDASLVPQPAISAALATTAVVDSHHDRDRGEGATRLLCMDPPMGLSPALRVSLALLRFRTSHPEVKIPQR